MMAPKLESEFAQHARRLRIKWDDRRFWQGLTGVVIFYLVAPHLLLAIATRFPALPEMALRLLNGNHPSESPVKPEQKNAGSSRPLP
jgi:hypothetical protein